MQINCKYCDNKIKIANLKLGAEDWLKDEFNQSLENMQGGTISDKSYNPKQDLVDKDWQYLDRGTRKYKRRTDRPMSIVQDTESVSNVAFIVGDTLLVKCGGCGSVYAGIFPPESIDTYHHTVEENMPQSPIGYSNETHPDNNRVHSSPDIPEEQQKNKKNKINIEKIVNKIKQDYYKNEVDHNA